MGRWRRAGAMPWLFRADMRFADDPAKAVELVAKQRFEIRTAGADWKEAAGEELSLQLRHVNRCGEHRNELRNLFARRVCRGQHAVPKFDLDLLEPRFADRRDVLQHVAAMARGRRQRAQLAGSD